jgi:hypothetical protein
MTNNVPTMRKDANQLAKSVVDRATRERIAAELQEYRDALVRQQAGQPMSPTVQNLEEIIVALLNRSVDIPDGDDTAK